MTRAALYSIRTGLAAAVQRAGIRAVPMPTDNLNPPVAVITRSGIEYDQTMARGADQYDFDVLVFAGRWGERAAEQLIDDISDPSNALCLKAVVEGDSDLGLLCDYARVKSVSETSVAQVGEAVYLSVTFSVEIMVS